MVNFYISHLLIIDYSGLPLFMLQKDRKDDDVDPLLISGFLAALSQFASEISQSGEDILKFKKKEFEGVVCVIDDKVLCFLGDNLLHFPIDVYKTIFNFFYTYFIKNKQASFGDSSEQIERLLNTVFLLKKNEDIIIPKKNNSQPIFWDELSSTIYETIDSYRNIKEIALTTNLLPEVVHAIIEIFRWQKTVQIKKELRDYIVFKKTRESLLLPLKKEKYNKLFYSRPASLCILDHIDPSKNLRQLKNESNCNDLIGNLMFLIDNNLIESVADYRYIEILFHEYINLIIEEAGKAIGTQEVNYYMNKAFYYTDLNLVFSIENNKLDFIYIHDSLEELRKGMNSLQKIVDVFLQPIYSFHEIISEKFPENTLNIFANVFTKVLEKHSFTLERMGYLEQFCPEDFIS